eukprot:gene35628-53881_t
MEGARCPSKVCTKRIAEELSKCVKHCSEGKVEKDAKT